MVKEQNYQLWFGYPSRFHRRPFPLKVLALGLVVFSILGWMRFSQGISEENMLATITAAPLPIYWLITGAIWGLIGIVSAVFLWLRYTWSLWLIGVGTGLFTLWFWLDKALIQSNPDRWSNWLFIAIIFVVALVFIYSTLVYLHPEKLNNSSKEDTHE